MKSIQRRFFRAFATVFLLAVVSAGATAPSSSEGIRPQAGMLRYPDVSATLIVFEYADELWTVPRTGGVASPLASPPGSELFPKFSPDGKTIAFVGNYDGNADIYTVPVAGGIPFRVTYHPGTEILTDWTPDGRLMFYTNGLSGSYRICEIYTVAPTGGLPTKLPVPYGTDSAISPDGRWLAYTPVTTDFRTWKRYRGGWAPDIWLFDLKELKSKQITTWEGTDTLPMWHGERVYYLSDQGSNHKLNIWYYDTSNNERRQVTHFAEYDVKWPSIGPGPDGQGEIVFQCGPDLYLLDLATEEAHTVDLIIPGARPRLRPKPVDEGKYIQAWNISPTGKRAVVEARGDVWTLPAKNGIPRDLTRTSGVAERDPAWSPDGQWIAYFSDATGEYELYIQESDGKGSPRQVTRNGQVFRYNPEWSPDSKRIAFSDKTGALYLVTVDSGDLKLVDTDPWDNAMTVNWSSDSQWLAYAKANEANQFSSIWLYNLKNGEKHQVTRGMFNDSNPIFDRKGDYLYYVSNRSFNPTYDDLGTSFVYNGTASLLAVPLRTDVKWPYHAKSDEESWKGEKPKPDEQADSANDQDKSSEADEDDKSDEAPGADTGKDDEKKDEKSGEKKEIKPVAIELNGFEERGFALPVKNGAFGRLAVSARGALLYVRYPVAQSDGTPSILQFDLSDEKKQEKIVAAGYSDFVLSANGKKILALRDGSVSILNAAPDAKGDKVITDGMTVLINPREEWAQIFNDAWRIERDFFYAPNMHGVNWPAMRDRYAKMLDDCNSREDVGYVVSELISELNVGHAYYGGGDIEQGPSVSVGMLGARFTLENGAYRIAHIYEGAPWDTDSRGPLSEPGVDVKTGDYLLAVNHIPMDTSKDPWAAFQGLANKSVILTVSSKPSLDDSARDVIVTALPDDYEMRYRSWVESHRAYVEQKTGGQVGYIYVPDTGINGQNDLVRQFYGQIGKAGLIIDERWNSGGQIPNRFIELLNRPITNYWARRDGKDWPWPPDGAQGPKVMLINGSSGSGGDAFPWYFRQAGLGKLIGMRTWGGLVGISGNPQPIDGAFLSAPTFGFYKKNGTWGIEGHGVDPDIEVVDDPAFMVNGGDPQLDAAIAEVLAEIKDHPYVPPKRPPYPDKSGMGIAEKDK